MGTVSVAITAKNERSSIIEVTYELTGLSEKGNDEILRSLSDAEHETMLETWKAMIQENRPKINEWLAQNG